MSKKIVAMLMAVAMAFSLLPTAAFATEDETQTAGKKIYVDAANGNDTQEGVGTDSDKAYKTIAAAVAAAESGDTIQLGEGNYTLYGIPSEGHTKGKELTFIGQGAEKTAWNIGAEVPAPEKYGTEYNGDYSFDGAGTVVFQDMTLRSGTVDYLGFIRADKTMVEDCTINGKTCYWGYQSATFKDTTFNCPTLDYALWTYSSPKMTFDHCTFNSSGKVINVYNENSAADYTINFNNCTVNNTGTPVKQVLNINDSLVKGFTINITGDTVLKGFDTTTIVDSKTCSRLFGFGGKADSNNNKKTIVKFGGTTVWENGAMVNANAFHNSGMTADGVSYNNGVTSAGNSLYAEGYKDDAFTTKTTTQGKRTDTTKTCNYCGWSEKSSTYAWDVSRSKIASGLTKNSNGDWTTDVTLSLPSAEEELASDVVFVLDKSTSAALEEQALGMLDKLREQAESTKATVKVGVVIFNKQANVTPLTDLATGYDTIKQAIKQEISSGTNTHAGLLAGKQMLDEDTEVSANRKYLIFVSDGITYMYNAEPTATAWSFKADSWKHWAGPDNWKSKYSSNNPPADWSAWMTEIGAQVEAQGTEYEYSYDGTATKWTPEDDTTSKNYANSIDKALYLTYQVYQEAQTEGYNCYAVDKGSSTNYLWGPDFMNYLADGKTVNFDKIQNDILYAVSAGSTVTDIIGSKFSFEGIKSLTVGKQELTATKSGENTWYFWNDNTASESNYRFKVVYNSQDHQFVWTINEKVSNFAPVQLTYTVKLTKPETAAGTYGVTDLNGDEKVDDTGAAVDKTKALYTNQEAKLVPKDSDENTGEELTFPKPSVSYTVSSGNSGSHSGGSRPSLNTKDHYGYIIGYPVDYYTGQPTTDQTKKPVRPEGKITRAEVATIYFRMLTDESRTKFWSQSSGYSDVKTGDWFNNAVSTLSKAGIIAGYEDGSFRPNGYITRAEFATIAARFFDVTYNGKDLFPDISGHWAKDYINQAANKGFVNGYEDGTFKPDRNITRAEAVTLVNRTLDRHPDKNHFTKDMLVWPDNMDQTKWYYADMQEATNSHTYQMKENSDKTKYENWTKTLPIRNWEALEKAWSNANSSQGNGNVV